jgi:hypothetical protein
VVSYVVAQRTNEFGIRMALGATPVRVLQLVFASTAREVIAGMGLGVMLSVLLGRFLSQWAEASSQNTILFGAAILLLALTAASAAYIPARFRRLHPGASRIVGRPDDRFAIRISSSIREARHASDDLGQPYFI